jgi:hypothetical protein
MPTTQPLNSCDYWLTWRAIERRVCSLCLDRRASGLCGALKECRLRADLPRVVASVDSLPRDSYDAEFLQAIEEDVCRRCPNRNADGTCSSRETGRCALVTYLHLVVRAVDEALPNRPR